MSETRRAFLDPCRREGSFAGPNAGHLPNLVLETHERRRLRFYDDLLAPGQAVFVHFLPAGDDGLAVARHLAGVQTFLGEHLGRDVLLCSLASDPERSTPEHLGEIARAVGARPGWHFLTGGVADLDHLRRKLYVHPGGHGAGHGDAPDCSAGLARYGNERLGLWGSVPTRTSPEWIARRLSWVVPRPESSEATGPRRFHRKGPHPETFRS